MFLRLFVYRKRELEEEENCSIYENNDGAQTHRDTNNTGRRGGLSGVCKQIIVNFVFSLKIFQTRNIIVSMIIASYDFVE